MLSHFLPSNRVVTHLTTQLCVFLGSMSLMEGRDSAHTKQKFKDLYIPLISTNWQVWPLAQVRTSIHTLETKGLTSSTFS